MKKRGAMLVLVMLLIACLMVVSVGFLDRTQTEARASHLVMLSAQARQLAWTGLEGVRVRLLNDAQFPPPALDRDQVFFRFSEDVPNPGATKPLGRYHIQLDRRWMGPPRFILRAVSTGELGESSKAIRYSISCEFRTAVGQRGDLIHLLEEGPR